MSDSPVKPPRSLAIVQAQATQFDGPFFRYLSTLNAFTLAVYYLQTSSALRSYDPELGKHMDWDNDVASGYSFAVYPAGWLRRLRFGLSIVKARPSLLILSGFRSFDVWLLMFCARLFRVPVGIRCDNCFMDPTPASWRDAVRSFALKHLLRVYSTAHPVGTLAQEYLVAHGINPSRVFRFPYLVDRDMLTSNYALAAADRVPLRAQLGIAPGDLVVVGVMKFLHREDPLTLVRAFLSLDQTPGGSPPLPPIHLILIGEGPLRPEIETLVRQTGSTRVHLPGYSSYAKLPSFFAVSDVLVHPARRESWGVTVNEALVCGLPVIAAHLVGSTRDLIRSGVEGFTFPAGDWRALAEVLRRLLENPSLLAAIASRCRTSPALVPFTYEFVAADLARAIGFVSVPS